MTFWRLVEEILNALLFLIIGLEIAAIDLERRSIVAVAVMIPTVLVIRWFSVAASALPLNLHLPDRYGSLLILTWGGLCRLNVNSRTGGLLRCTLHVNLGLGWPQSQNNVIIGTEICRSFVSSVRQPRGPVSG